MIVILCLCWLSNVQVGPVAAQGVPTAAPFLATEGIPLELGRTVQGTFTKPQQRLKYLIFSSAGSLLTVGMFASRGSKLIPRIDLYGPNGDQISTASNPYGAIISGYPMTVTGLYVAYVSGSAPGQFEISTTASWTVRDQPRDILTPNQAVRGKLRRHGDRDLWIVNVPSEATLYVDVVPNRSGLIPALDIATTDGRIIARAESTPLTRRVILTPKLTAPGPYAIGVSSTANETIGGYGLIVRFLPSALTPTP